MGVGVRDSEKWWGVESRAFFLVSLEGGPRGDSPLVFGAVGGGVDFSTDSTPEFLENRRSFPPGTSLAENWALAQNADSSSL